jgi:hypothetical protein
VLLLLLVHSVLAFAIPINPSPLLLFPIGLSAHLAVTSCWTHFPCL